MWNLSQKPILNGEPLHRHEVMARLRMTYGSALAFERKKKLRARSVRDVLSGRCKNDRTARAIARALGINMHQVSKAYHEKQYQVGTNSSATSQKHCLNQGAR